MTIILQDPREIILPFNEFDVNNSIFIVSHVTFEDGLEEILFATYDDGWSLVIAAPYKLMGIHTGVKDRDSIVPTIIEEYTHMPTIIMVLTKEELDPFLYEYSIPEHFKQYLHYAP